MPAMDWVELLVGSFAFVTALQCCQWCSTGLGLEPSIFSHYRRHRSGSDTHYGYIICGWYQGNEENLLTARCPSTKAKTYTRFYNAQKIITGSSMEMSLNFWYGQQEALKSSTKYYCSQREIVAKEVYMVKDLGVAMSNNVTFSDHITKIMATARQLSSWS